MTSILIVYGTGEGQTAKVAAFVESVLADRGFDVTTRHVFETDDADIGAFDAVLVGSSVNNRAHRPEVVAFVERHRETLASLPTGFFQLSLASAVSTKWARDGALRFVDGLTESTGWTPDRVGLFAGALTFSQYGRAERFVFRLAAIVMGLDGDTTRDYEYTDWGDVERFAVEFGEFVEHEVAERERSRAKRGARVRTIGRSAVRSVALSALGAAAAGVAYWALRRRCSTRGEDENATRP